MAEPDNLELRWLLNLSAMLAGTYPKDVPEAFRLPDRALESDAPLPRFVDVARSAGLGQMGIAGGTLVEDFDGDGLFDVVMDLYVSNMWGDNFLYPDPDLLSVRRRASRPSPSRSGMLSPAPARTGCRGSAKIQLPAARATAVASSFDIPVRLITTMLSLRWTSTVDDAPDTAKYEA